MGIVGCRDAERVRFLREPVRGAGVLARGERDGKRDEGFEENVKGKEGLVMSLSLSLSVRWRRERCARLVGLWSKGPGVRVRAAHGSSEGRDI